MFCVSVLVKLSRPHFSRGHSYIVDATIHLRIEFPKLDIVLCACGLVCVNLSFCAKEDTLLVFLHTDQVR